jgi:hypothetical protein
MHQSLYNPLQFFTQGALQDMDIEWQPYVDTQGGLTTDYNELTMLSYVRNAAQSFWDNTLAEIQWNLPLLQQQPGQ